MPSASRRSGCSAARRGTISAIRPLKDGVIADFDVTEQMLRHFIEKVHQHRFAHPRVVVLRPRRRHRSRSVAVEEATLSAGARQAYLIEEPMAAAIGAGLPVSEPTGNMIVDIAVAPRRWRSSRSAASSSAKACASAATRWTRAIIHHIKTEYKLLVGQQTAEEIKLESARPSTCETRFRPRSEGATCSPVCRRR